MSDAPARYARVFVNKPLETAYSYRVPARLAAFVAPGSRVEVPLGKGKAMGLVVAVDGTPPVGVPQARLRPLHRVLEAPPALGEDLLDLGRQVAEYYLCAPGEAYQAMVPSYSRPEPPPRFLLEGPLEAALEQVGTRATKQRRLLEVLARAGEAGATRRQLLTQAGPGALEALESRGLVRRQGQEVPVLEVTPPGPAEAPGDFPELLAPQQAVFEELREDLAGGRHRVHLLHGITGSGKTEVYLAAIREALRRGRGALFLVPEIALTVAMIEKVKARLGDLLAVMHSGQGPKERYEEWARARTGRARVVLGPRSAVFAPVQQLGLIVLDEEQEGSYKQQDKPRYHAREVATWRAARAGFPVVLGSATPTLESFHGAKEGALVYHRLTRRFRQAALPPVELVDMSEEFRERRNSSVFSMRLKERLQATLEGGGQALLFMNRRGFHTYVFCRRCSFVLECEHCSVALTFHLDSSVCLCHHCGHRAAPPQACPSCSSRAIRYAGTGTQRVAREFGLNFPDHRYQRMDSDTTRGRGSHARILGDFARGQTRVLIGTQMLAKGFDFPGIHLVGVVNADGGLKVPDFRGAERTFQLLTQVAGRVGRGDDPGEVVVQTYQPDHYALQAARRHDYEAFAARELPLRQELFYPPFSRLVLAVHEAATEEAALRPLEDLREHLERVLGGGPRVRLLGPAPAPLMRLEGRHRQQLLIKIEPGEAAGRALREALRGFPGAPPGLKIDVDPMSLM